MCLVHIFMYVGLFWKAFITLRSDPYLHHIYQPEQPFLQWGRVLGWSGSEEEVGCLLRWKKNTTNEISARRLFNINMKALKHVIIQADKVHTRAGSCLQQNLSHGNISQCLLWSVWFSLTHTANRKEEWVDSQTEREPIAIQTDWQRGRPEK